jgi:hypothetical protein
VIAVIGRGASAWRAFYGTVKVHEYWRDLFGEVPEGARVHIAASAYWNTIPFFDMTPHTFYADQTVRQDPEDGDFYLCIAPFPGYTTGEDPLAPSEDAEHWRRLRRGFAPTFCDIATVPYFGGRIAPEEVVKVWVDPNYATEFAFFPPAYPAVGKGWGLLEFIACPRGIPPTGVETSYRPGDDGAVRAGGGAVPATGVVTSYRNGDDGDIQAGVKG